MRRRLGLAGVVAAIVGGGPACGAPEPAASVAAGSVPREGGADRDVDPSTREPTVVAAPGAFDLPGLAPHAPDPRLGWPVESVHITSSFGWRVDPVSGIGTRLHRGIDLRGTPGDLVLSIGAGRISFVGHDPLLGNLVVVDHGEGLESYYGHLSDLLVVADVDVDRGAAIGLVGNTGRSAAPHLHLTIKLDGVAIDPLELLGEPQYRPEALATPLEALEPEAPTPDEDGTGADGTTSGPGSSSTSGV